MPFTIEGQKDGSTASHQEDTLEVAKITAQTLITQGFTQVTITDTFTVATVWHGDDEAVG